MRDHDDQPVARDLFQKLHDLHAGLAVQRAGGLVREDDVGVVDESTRDGDALHLPAGHLAGSLFRLLFKPHFPERFQGALSALLLGDARERQAELDVLQDVHVRDEVVALEDEADPAVAVGVPVLVTILRGGDAVHADVTARIAVQAAHDVEECGLAAAGRSEDGDEFALSELHGHAAESEHALVFRAVLFGYINEFKHGSPYFTRTPCALILEFNLLILTSLDAHYINTTRVVWLSKRGVFAKISDAPSAFFTTL